MNGKLVSLFDHPEFVRRSQARAQRELAAKLLPDAEPCPPSERPPEVDLLEAFLNQILSEP
jgi:hypothetical protein